jgi:AraC-like DNA-binding protein
MQAAAPPLLDSHRIFRSRNAEEAHAYLRHKEFQLDLDPRQAGELDVRINGVYLPGLWFGYFEYGAPVATRAVRRDDYWVQLPIRGRIEAASERSSVVCDGRRAAVLSPTSTDFYLVRSSAGAGRLCLSLTAASLTAQLAALLGDAPSRLIELSPEMDVTWGHGQRLFQQVLATVADLEGGAPVLDNPVAMGAFEQLILTGLLLSHPHNYSEALRRLDRPIAPRDVKRAVAFIEAQLGSGFTLADLVRVTGVAGRTLYKHFRDFKGVSPMRYARNARFRAVRRALQRAEPEQGVAAIAAECGFTHMGRFAVEYRRRFGESPSQTLRRRPRRGV